MGQSWWHECSLINQHGSKSFHTCRAAIYQHYAVVQSMWVTASRHIPPMTISKYIADSHGFTMSFRAKLQPSTILPLRNLAIATSPRLKVCLNAFKIKLLHGSYIVGRVWGSTTGSAIRILQVECVWKQLATSVSVPSFILVHFIAQAAMFVTCNSEILSARLMTVKQSGATL